MGLAPELTAALKARTRTAPSTAPSCTVWPSNTTAVALFERLLTQWRVGPGGVIGLDYAVLPLVARACGISTRTACESLPALQLMEDEALSVYSELFEQSMDQSKRRTLH